jgi:CRISPR-associated protein Cmr6
MKNLNLLFHKLYYDKIGEGENNFEDAVKESNRKIFDATFVNSNFLKCDIPGVKTFRMKTKYPGLLIGTGYPHGSGRADDDIKCGFSFDYTTGQPYIPGSSIKGVLRSVFQEHPEAIAAIATISEKSVEALEKNIFDNGDIFLDAVLYDGDKNNHVLGCEYITPHKNAMKNPIPIHIMKILPDVRFEFRFIVSDFNAEINAAKKIEIFKTLLSFFGVGAKTNVGYGILEEDDSAPHARVPQEQSEKQTENNNGKKHNRNDNYGNKQKYNGEKTRSQGTMKK